MAPEHNFTKAASFIARAAAQGAHLAVLPEYHLLNWLPDDPKYAELCQHWRTYLDKYCALARQHKICIVPGTIVERHTHSSTADTSTKQNDNNHTEGEQDKDDEELDLEQAEEEGRPLLYNSAYFIDAQGQILHRYQKKNLWHPERPHLTSSRHEPHAAFDTPLGRVGMLICWDLAFPEAFRELIADGAKMVIIPTFWTLNDVTAYGRGRNEWSERVFLESVTVARAFENTAAVVFVNAGADPEKVAARIREGREEGAGSYAGLSRVTVPFLGALGDETKDSTVEGMSVVEVDMADVEEGEENYKVRGDIGSEGWHYTYRHQRNKL